MKKISAVMIIAGLAASLLAFSMPVAAQSHQENNFLKEAKTVLGAYEFTKPGDYKFIVTEVKTPEHEYMNLCLEGRALELAFHNLHAKCPNPEGEFRCITGLRDNIKSNEYEVKGIKVGSFIQAWPSNPGAILQTKPINSITSKWDPKTSGPELSWENEGYTFKVIVLKED